MRNKTAIPVSFNASLKVDFLGPRVTLDGGLILVQQLVERLRFSELIGQPAAAGLTLGGRTRSCPWPEAHNWLPDSAVASGAKIAVGNESVGCILLWIRMPKWKSSFEHLRHACRRKNESAKCHARSS